MLEEIKEAILLQGSGEECPWTLQSQTEMMFSQVYIKLFLQPAIIDTTFKSCQKSKEKKQEIF